MYIYKCVYIIDIHMHWYMYVSIIHTLSICKGRRGRTASTGLLLRAGAELAVLVLADPPRHGGHIRDGGRDRPHVEPMPSTAQLQGNKSKTTEVNKRERLSFLRHRNTNLEVNKTKLRKTQRSFILRSGSRTAAHSRATTFHSPRTFAEIMRASVHTSHQESNNRHLRKREPP